jgi:hypothetical protein
MNTIINPFTAGLGAEAYIIMYWGKDCENEAWCNSVSTNTAVKCYCLHHVTESSMSFKYRNYASELSGTSTARSHTCHYNSLGVLELLWKWLHVIATDTDGRSFSHAV